MDDKYLIFWNWFTKHKQMLSNLNINDSFIMQLDSRVLSLGNFVWEVGPGINKPHSFTISPGGDFNLLKDTKRIISFAPKLEDWEFYYAKRIKDWNNYFHVIADGVKYAIDISKWEYILLAYEDKTFDIIVKPNPYPFELEEKIYGVLEMVLDSIVGEEHRLEQIKYTEVVADFDSDLINSKSLLVNLKDHFEHLLLSE